MRCEIHSFARLMVLSAALALPSCAEGPEKAEAHPAIRVAPAPAAPAPAPPPPASAPESKPDISASISRGHRWLLSKQNPDGGFGASEFVPEKGSDVGLSAFALYALARTAAAGDSNSAQVIERAEKFLLAIQQPSGAFVDPRDPSLQNYKTSVAVLALLTLGHDKHAEPIHRAVAHLKGLQFDEGKKVSHKDWQYGGVGYGSDPTRPDLSNHGFASEALASAGISGADDFWYRAQLFVARCQNAPTVDPVLAEAKVGTTSDLGFRYAPTATRGNSESIDGGTVFSSYGSMTYMGLKSLLYANVKKDDPRVKGAFAWIAKNFTVKENPGMATVKEPLRGQQGLFYYYQTMAKALSVYGEAVVTDEKGVRHDWARELGEHLASIQKPDGFWDNPAERWMEGIELLDTSYALVALATCQGELTKSPPK